MTSGWLKNWVELSVAVSVELKVTCVVTSVSSASTELEPASFLSSTSSELFISPPKIFYTKSIEINFEF